MSKRIKGITIELDGDTKGLDKALKDVNKESRNIQKELRDVDRLLKFNPKNVELLAQKKKLLADQVENTKKKLTQLKSAQEQVTQAFKNGEISEKQYRDFQREIAETESKLKHYESQLKSVDSTQRSFAEKVAASGKTVKELGQNMTSFGKEMTMKVTAPLMAIGGIAAKIGMDFKAGMSEVQALSGATGEELAQLEGKARELGASTKFSAKQVSEGFKYMALAGWDVQQSMAGIDGVLSLSAASGEDLARVSDILTDAISAFGDQAKDASRYADVMAAASSNANTDVSGLGEAFKMVAPVAGALGYSLEDTSVALGLMANAGVKGSAAGTALRSALTNLVKPTKAMKDEMKKLGINVKDSNGEMKPLDRMLKDLRGSFGKLGEAEKASAAATIFGKEAMSGMLAVINASDQDFNKLTKAIANSEGVAKEMADTMQNNLQGKLTNLKSALEELAIKIFDALEPALKAIVGSVQSLVDWLNGLSKEARTTVVVIASIVAAIGPLAVILGTLLTMVGGFMTVLPALVPLLAALAGPVGLLVGTLTALGVAFALTRPQAEEMYKEQTKLAEQNLELSKSYSEVLDEKHKQIDKTADLIASTKEQMEVTDDLVSTFEGLIDKSKLSTEELGKFLTLQSELEHTKSPQKIAEIEAQMEKLREKSGLSKDEFYQLLDVNSQLTEKFPEAGSAVDDYGNKIADTTGKLKEMTQAELERKGLEVYTGMVDDLRTVNEEIDNYKYIMGEIFTLEDAISGVNEQIRLEKESINETSGKIEENNAKILDLQEQQKGATAEEYWKLEDKKTLIESSNSLLEDEIKKNKKNIEELEKAKSVDEENLKVKKAQGDKIEGLIDKNNQQYQQYLEMLEVQYGIVLEQGKENESIDKAITKRNEEIKKLDDKIKKEGDSNGKKQEAIDKLEREKKQLDDIKTKIDTTSKTIEEQNGKYEKVSSSVEKVKVKVKEVDGETKSNIKSAELLNKELGENVNKHVKVNTNKDADEENSKWSKPISKVVNFLSKGLPKFWAEGTNYHPGGKAVLGEEGPELVKSGGKMQLASFGMYDLPMGAQVFTHEDTVNMLRNGLIDGISRGVNFQRSQLSTQGSTLTPTGNSDLVSILTEQNQLLMQLLQKDNTAVVEFEPFYNTLKKRMTEDQYAQRKQRRK